jgi:hypothetical protein
MRKVVINVFVESALLVKLSSIMSLLTNIRTIDNTTTRKPMIKQKLNIALAFSAGKSAYSFTLFFVI